MINKRLVTATSYDPTKQSQSQTISQLNDDIENKKISLPIYQRDLSWTLKKVVDLFNYQLYGKAPVSPLSLNQISLAANNYLVPQVELLSRNLIDDEDIREGQKSVIDGQQRLTSNYKAYCDDDSFRNIVLDLSRGYFREVKQSPNNNQIPVGKLLNKNDQILYSYLNNVAQITDFNDISIILKARTKINQYSYTLHIANGMDEREQIQWFEVLNNAGSKVSALQMTFAKLGSKGFDIYASYGEPFRNKIDAFDLDELFSPYTTNVSYPIAMLNPELELIQGKNHSNNFAPIPSDTKESQLTKLTVSELKNITSKTLESLDFALSFIDDNNLSSYVNRMDYIMYVTGYISYKGHSNINGDGLIDWVKNVDFSNKSNSERRQLYTDLLAI
ncbi:MULTISPECIES: DUF262 domain-containing protein [Leuconostoc]|uniref:DUF262 domain-containing protein n=1 Tax=Leuconostoc TaxID=1243 RepID=UPI0007509852|nr:MULTISPECIES: DUF262 domain-containing protein [Leuconostoc]NYS22366.1 DUF262 domain-containing protein [Leuconostoc sp. DB-1]